MLQVTYERGVYLPEFDLWLDPWDQRSTAFVSHAHTDHIGNHQEVILSAVTGRLMAARLPGERIEHRLAFGQTIQFRNAHLTLLPAGHIFGSAQIYLLHKDDSLLYTGDFKLRPGRSAEPVEWCHAATLIMETTYGLPRYVFPPTESVIEELTRFCAEAIEERQVPILFGYSLGKAQEILAALQGSGFRILLHPQIYRLTRLYEEMRDRLPDYSEYDPATLTGSVLICPGGANRTRLVQQIRNRRTAMLTGWALNPGAVHRYQCDAVFPLSDHADYPDLIRYVELVQPQRVLTLHGFAREFAEDLRRRGVEAWALGEGNQLELFLPASTVGRLSRAGGTPPAPEPDALQQNTTGLARFASMADAISQNSSKLKKVEMLAGYLAELSEEELRIAAIFFTGHAFSRADGRALQVGWAIIHKALRLASNLAESEFRRISASYGDAGRIAYEVLLNRTTGGNCSMSEARRQFEQLERSPGPAAKSLLLAEWLTNNSARNGSYIIRILTGDLRIGLKEGLVEEAIAMAFGRNLEDVREAHMLIGDLGETAVLARRDELTNASIALFRPVKCMLAIAEPNAETIYQRISQAEWHGLAAPVPGPGYPGYAIAEQKYDGIRAQLHASKAQISIFSRDLRNISDEFPELTSLTLADELILDGEILAFSEGKNLTFFDLQKRLGRKRSLDLFETDDVPVIYMAFDLLWLNGQSLLKQDLRYRRATLEQLRLPDRIRPSPIRWIRTAEEIEEGFLAARRAQNEGLMIKDPGSAYTPGCRGGSWIKYKKELATLDVVVVAAEQGHGKRNHVLSDYTFAVRDEESGALLPIGKAYSGLTDAEIEELTEHFQRTTTRLRGRLREVHPEIVLEIAFDSIQPSERHSSGLALRFPRIKAIRRDKTVAEIDTVQHARRLAGMTASF
jgi:ATP-dependent DNA ligase I